MKTANKYDKQKSAYRKVIKRLKELSHIAWNEGWEELPKPQPYGWFKELTLTKEVLRRHDADVFVEILQACKIDIWAFEQQHLENKWKVTYKNKKRQKPGLKKLNSKEYNQLSSKARKYFMQEVNDNWRYSNERILFACTLPRIFFDHQYKRAYVYRVQKLNSEVASEIRQLQNSLERKFYDLHSPNQYLRAGKDWTQKRIDAYKRKINLALNEVITSNTEREILYQDYKVERF